MVLLVTLLVTPVAYSLFDQVKFRRSAGPERCAGGSEAR